MSDIRMSQADAAQERLTAGAIQAKEEDARVASFKRTMEVVNRLLSYNAATLVVTRGPNAIPGWTDGETITLNRTGLPPLCRPDGRLDTKALLVWLGVNSHEVGHTLWTPRKNSPLMVRLARLEEGGLYKGIRRIENMVEDQRQERLTIAKFRTWGIYLTAAAAALIGSVLARSSTDSDHEAATKAAATWPLLVGRTWLPADMRRAARDAWPGDGRELARLVGQYQRIRDPGYDDAPEAVEVLMELHRLLVSGGVQPETIMLACKHGEKGGSVQERMGDGDMPDVLEVDDDVVPSAGSDADTDALDAVPDPDAPDTDDGQGDSADADADDGDGEGDGAGSGDGDMTDADADGDGDSGASGDGADDASGDGSGGGSDDSDIRMSDDGSSAESGSGATNQGTNASPAGPPTVEDLANAVMDAATETLAEDASAARDLEEIKDALDDRRRRPSGLGSDNIHGSLWGENKMLPVTAETRRLARQVSDHVRKLVDAALPQWVRRTQSGKLHVGRYMRRQVGDPYDTMFDRFQFGQQDDISLEVWILLDVSSSMHDKPQYGPRPDGTVEDPPFPIERAAEATWAIRRAVEAAEGICTVIGFSTVAHEIAGPHRKPDPHKVVVPRTGGGTNPEDAVNEVWAQVRSSEAAHKVVVAVTDGDWAGGGTTMRALSQRGVTTIGIVLDPYCERPKNGHQFTRRTDYDQALENARAVAENRTAQMGTTHNKIMEDCHGMVELFDRVVTEMMADALRAGRL